MQGLQLSPNEWRLKLDDCRKCWSQLCPDERAVYVAKAAEEEGLRCEAMKQPMISKKASRSHPGPGLSVDQIAPAAFDAASELNRNSLKKLSRHRVLASFKKLRESSAWEHHDAGLSDFEGVLSLDAIDLASPEDALAASWNDFVSSDHTKRDWVPQVDGEIEIHDKTCWMLHGCCAKRIDKGLVGKLVHGLGGQLAAGALHDSFGMRIALVLLLSLQ